MNGKHEVIIYLPTERDDVSAPYKVGIRRKKGDSGTQEVCIWMDNQWKPIFTGEGEMLGPLNRLKAGLPIDLDNPRSGIIRDYFGAIEDELSNYLSGHHGREHTAAQLAIILNSIIRAKDNIHDSINLVPEEYRSSLRMMLDEYLLDAVRRVKDGFQYWPEAETSSLLEPIYLALTEGDRSLT